MEQFTKPNIFYYSVTLIYIVVSIFCAIVRWFHVCKPYKDIENYLFPVRRPLSFIFLMGFLQLPYLLNIDSDSCFLFVLIYPLIIYPQIFLYVLKRYFFLNKISKFNFFIIWINPFIYVSLFTILSIFCGEILYQYRLYFCVPSLVLFAFQIFFLTKLLYEIRKRSMSYFSMDFSEFSDYPYNYVMKVLFFIPLIVFSLMLFNFIAFDRFINMYITLFFTGANIFVLVYVLDHHRRLSFDAEKNEVKCISCSLDNGLISVSDETNNNFVSFSYNNDQLNNINYNVEEVGGVYARKIEDSNVKCDEDIKIEVKNKQCQILMVKIEEVFREKEVYKNPDFKINDLVRMVNSNKNYVSQAISSSEYKSFNKMVNKWRIDSCMAMLESNPQLKLEDIAYSSGFASRSTFSRAFKEITGYAPSVWLEFNMINRNIK